MKMFRWSLCALLSNGLEENVALQLGIYLKEDVMMQGGADMSDGRSVSFSIDSDGETDNYGNTANTTTLACGCPVPDGCPAPASNAFKVCAIWGDPHMSSTFAGPSYSAENRFEGRTGDSHPKVINHYGLGLYDMFKNKDGSIHVQGFFCAASDGALRGNSLNMAVAKINNTRIVWKRPAASLKNGPVSCEVLPPQHNFSMEMSIDGQIVPHDMVESNGFGNGEIWANSLHLDAWEFVPQQKHFCAGDTDRRVTIKMASLPTKCAWMPTMIIELAEDEVEHAPTSLCSLEEHDTMVATVDAVPFSKSLFTVEELHAMCDGCQLKSSNGAEFAGCNPPAPNAYTGVEFCAQQEGDPAAMLLCDKFSDPHWKDACLIEVCSIGAAGADETAFFDVSGDPLQTMENELAGEYEASYYKVDHENKIQKSTKTFTLVIACDGSVTSPTNPEKFTNAHLAFEQVSTKCSESPHAVMWLANSERGKYECLERQDTSLIGADYDWSSNKKMNRGIELRRTVSYSNCDACSIGCKACLDAHKCIVCQKGWVLESDECDDPNDITLIETATTATVTTCPCTTKPA